MSYILEALRRSQAERERGRVPGLDAQPGSGPGDSSAARVLPVAWVRGGVAAAVLLLVALTASWWTRQQPPLPLSPSPPAAGTVAAPPPLQAPLPVPVPAPPPVLPTLPQVVSAPPAPPQVSTQPAPPARGGAAPDAAAATAAPVVQASAARLPAQPPPTVRAVTLGELSPEQRRDLPAMAIGGSIWSDNVANRFVIVNGQLVREGEAAAPGALLERITPKSVIVRWRDLRVELPL